MSAMEAYWAAPPVSRTLVTATLITSAAVYGGLVNPSRLVFTTDHIFKLPTPEIWRLLTAFCITGPGLSIMFDCFFLWNYSKTIETESPRFTRPGDYAVYIFFLSSIILRFLEMREIAPSAHLSPSFAKKSITKDSDALVAWWKCRLRKPARAQATTAWWFRLPTNLEFEHLSRIIAGYCLRGIIFTQALILGIAYTFSQDNKNKKVSLFIISFQAIYLPWVMLGLTLVLGGPSAAMLQASGLIAAHLYDFLTRLWPSYGGGRNPISTPLFVQKWFGGDQKGTTVRGYGTAFRPPTQQPSTAASSTGFSFGSSWGARGRGHRLGGD